VALQVVPNFVRENTDSRPISIGCSSNALHKCLVIKDHSPIALNDGGRVFYVCSHDLKVRLEARPVHDSLQCLSSFGSGSKAVKLAGANVSANIIAVLIHRKWLLGFSDARNKHRRRDR
jgi:hypothetical protein